MKDALIFLAECIDQLEDVKPEMKNKPEFISRKDAVIKILKYEELNQ